MKLVYLTDAFAEAKAGGYYLLVAPNSTPNNAAGGSRKFLLDNRTWGAKVEITGVTFAQRVFKFTVGEKSFEAAEELVLVNELTDKAASYKMVIYTKDFTEETITCNGYGAALVLDKYGKVVRIYDGANGKLFDAENPSGKTGAGFGGADYATYAYTQLQAGETLIIFPNDGTNGADSARTFALGLRMDGSIGKVATLTGHTFEEEKAAALKIGTNEFTKEEITYTINDATATNTSHDFLIFTSAFTGTFSLNGYGEAFVIKDGAIVRIYDGVSGKYYDADNTAGVTDATKCTANDYAKFAIASLQSGEWVLIAPHDGGSNVAREFLYSNRTIGATVEFNLAQIETSTEAENAFSLNAKTFYGAKVLVNSSAAPANYDFAVYSYGYAGRVVKNGWCEAFVIDMTTGKVVRIYDGVNNKYYDEENTAGVAGTDYYTVATTSFDAFESLKPNELLVIGLNGGKNSNAARAFLVSNRTFGAQASVLGIELPTPASTETKVNALVVDGDKYYLSSPILENENAVAAGPFVIYRYGYEGSLVTNGYGVAFVIKDGKIVRIYDGASAKYYDADNASGVQNGTCTSAGYLTEAFASLSEGEYVLAALNTGGANITRAFFYDHRSVGKDVTVPTSEDF